jgi:hypothetical protein
MAVGTYYFFLNSSFGKRKYEMIPLTTTAPIVMRTRDVSGTSVWLRFNMNQLPQATIIIIGTTYAKAFNLFTLSKL